MMITAKEARGMAERFYKDKIEEIVNKITEATANGEYFTKVEYNRVIYAMLIEYGYKISCDVKGEYMRIQWIE